MRKIGLIKMVKIGEDWPALEWQPGGTDGKAMSPNEEEDWCDDGDDTVIMTVIMMSAWL